MVTVRICPLTIIQKSLARKYVLTSLRKIFNLARCPQLPEFTVRYKAPLYDLMEEEGLEIERYVFSPLARLTKKLAVFLVSLGAYRGRARPPPYTVPFGRVCFSSFVLYGLATPAAAQPNGVYPNSSSITKTTSSR